MPTVHALVATGGGGGATNASSGGNGANGLVIISYPTGSMTATGGSVGTSGGNTIHTFLFADSGTSFTITSPSTVGPFPTHLHTP